MTVLSDKDGLDALYRAHALFIGAQSPSGVQGNLDAATHRPVQLLERAEHVAAVPSRYRYRLGAQRAELQAARGVDADVSAIVHSVHREHNDAYWRTKTVLAAARSDARTKVDNPLIYRELLLRRIARLRIQYGHVRSAQRYAHRYRTALAALRYRVHRNHLRGNGIRLSHRYGRSIPNASAATAIRAALSRRGAPYVWGGNGPDRFDCSGLVVWAYQKAGIDLPRTTYDQIGVGIPVGRSDIQPGDLVFPHTGHVQLALGNNLVVEAPHAGAAVRISPLGAAAAIRRVV